MSDPTLLFDPAVYGEEVAAILGDGRKLLPLTRGEPDVRFRTAIEVLEVAPAVRAGLWAYHDFWDEAHEVAQEIDTAEGSFWHAVLHRREPDAGNSNYWWHRVGRHSVLAALVREAPALGYSYTNPRDFVAFCETVAGTASVEELTARRVQLLEWQLLFAHCCHDSK